MKCLVLAGGRGERLWPLSRKNYPKQFIQIQKNHSVFQETVARNIPYCDEFIIVTSYEYRFIIENQMKAFRGTPYRCVFEEEPRKTTAAIMLSCLGFPPSEFIFVVAADHLIDTDFETTEGKKGYRDAVLQAKEYARDGAIVLFGMLEATDLLSRFGYIIDMARSGEVGQFIEKPDKPLIAKMRGRKDIYRNLGMLLFENAIFQHELASLEPAILKQCKEAYAERQHHTGNVFYKAGILRQITPVSIERCILERSRQLKAVKIGFEWSELGSLEDLGKTDYHTDGVSITNDCTNTMVINNSTRQAVVVNDLDNVMVVNTTDAVYIGRYGKSSEMKAILRDYPELRPYADKGTKFYRSWGVYEQLIEEQDYRIRRVFLFPGKTIYAHKHLHRSEYWIIVRGKALVALDGLSLACNVKDNINIPIGMEHQISNIGEEPLVFVETAIGEKLQGRDMVSCQVDDVVESKLGYSIEPMVRLLPVFKDYLWGGTKIRDVYGMDCDYERIAESWLLSCHPDGQSIVAEGKHKGVRFGEYLSVVGKDVLGWKCRPLHAFPLLVKLIDANANLSVQVHPNDDYALMHENECGKNEMWYVIDAEPGAGLYLGFKKDVSKEEVRRRVADNTILDVLNFYTTKKGDVFFIPTGTVHAIGSGNLICEIQQSSNCTYRLYDYNRSDKFGNQRKLQLERALDVLDFSKYEPMDFKEEKNEAGVILGQCKYFQATIYEVDGEEKIKMDDSRFYSIVCIRGSGMLELVNCKMMVTAGESVFIPAADDVLRMHGKLTVILSHI